MSSSLSPQAALIVVDMQNDFMPGGALAVADSDQIIPVINQLLPRFPLRILTRDWHPKDHISFSDQPSFTDKSWPAHCVQDTPGAEFHPDLRQDLADKIVSKAQTPDQDAYSGFQDTDLESWLAHKNVLRVYIAGVATEYCVKSTALDAMQAGFETFIISDAVRGVNLPPGSETAEINRLQKAGVRLISSQEILST
jgi:nicotinamidase/pyrazinamidase